MHRWIVAIPLVLLLVVLTLREGLVRAPMASLIPMPQTHVQSEPGADVRQAGDDIELHEGSVLVASSGLATVKAGTWSVQTWGGAAYLSYQHDRLTVAAIDVPVLVRGEHSMAVVPPMQQWRGVSTLPDASGDPAAWAAALALQPLPEQFLRDQAAIVDAWNLKATGEVSSLDTQALVALSTPELATYALTTKPTQTLSAAIRSRGELRSYALLQPVVRDAAWAFRPVDDVDASTWVALLSLPRLERDDATASPLTVRAWGEALEAALNASAEPDALRSSVLPVLEDDINDIVSNGYPLRALRFAQAIDAAVGTGAVLTADATASLERLRAMTPETLRASVLADLEQSLPVPVVRAAAVPVEHDPALEARAREMLTANGGMFTSDTRVETVGDGWVTVKDVVYGLPSGDRLLRFAFRPEDGSARAIIDGEIQPYGVPFTQYLEWEAWR